MGSTLYAASLFVATVVSQNTDCSYGTFETNPATGTCMFDCEHDNRYVALDTLSFDIIREECANVNYAAMFYPSECSNVSDLVWPTSSCDCPSCKCSSADFDGEYHTHTQYVSKRCVHCTCEATFNNTDLAFACGSVTRVSDPQRWNDFTCPPTECMDSDGSTYPSSTSWWKTTTVGVCQRCYCTGSGSSVCATGYNNILASSNEALAYDFRERCGSDTRDCVDDSSRMFDYYASISGNQCNSCPRCDCGSHGVGDSWYTKYQDTDDERTDSYSCAKCTCVEGPYGNYSDCDDVSGYSDAVGTCPPDSQIQCHSQYSRNGSLTVDATLSPTDCSDSVQAACGWDAYESGDVYWGCDNILSCEAFFETDGCQYYNYSFTYTDCDGVEQTETYAGAKYCCTSENCNHESIDTSTCSRGTYYEDIIAEFSTCFAENDDCITETDTVEITCDGIRSLFESSMECICNLYGSIYSRLSSSVQQTAQHAIDGVSDLSSQWNSVFGCDIGWSCNLEKGGVLVDATLTTSPTKAPIGTDEPASQFAGCSYGTFETNPATGTCMFDCEYENRYVALDMLSFDFIREECDNVNYAAMFYHSECSNVSDLVWPASSCGCPSCKCSSADIDGEYHPHTQYVSKTCVQCMCAANEATFNDTELVFSCNSVTHVFDPQRWNDFTCPPTECMDSDGNLYPSSTSWWKTTAIGTCQRCYCTGSGTSVCATGYSNILASSNEALAYEFRDGCDHYTTDCIGDGSRMFDYYGASSSSQCDNCPRCDCGSHEVGDSWYTLYQDTDNERTDSYSCAKCTCVEGPSGNYTDCDSMSQYADACPPESQIQCHSQYSDNGSLTVDATLSPTDCSDSVQAMCGWDIYEDGGTSWGCQDGIFCVGLFEPDACTYYNVSTTFTDCDGVEQTETYTGTQYCCTSENCNHESIDTSTCSRATYYEDMIRDYYTHCNLLGCITETDNVEITCDGIESLFKSTIGCYCGIYSPIYGRLSSSVHKQVAQYVMDEMVASSSEWNAVFGCDIDLSCNLAEGVVVDATLTASPTTQPSGSPTAADAAASQLALFTMMWTPIVTLMMR